MLKPSTVQVIGELLLAESLIRTGERLGENDNWIAGFCRYYREPLISQDRDFDRVRGLRRLAY